MDSKDTNNVVEFPAPVRSCTCPSVQQIPTSIFRPTVTAKPAGSPVGCARSRYSAGSAP